MTITAGIGCGIVLASIAFACARQLVRDCPPLIPRRKDDILRNRNHRVEVYYNDEEFSELQKLVTKSGLRREEYMRQSSLNVTMKELPQLEFFDILKNLRQINNNLNQIAMKANATGIIDARAYRDNYSSLQEQVGEIIRGIY